MAELLPASPAASQGPIHTAIAGLSARLLACFPATKFQHEVMPAPLTEAALGKLSQARAPFVGLAFIGFRPTGNSSARLLNARLSFGVYLVASNPRNAPRLLGDAQGIGLAQMVHVAIIGLHGHTIAGLRDAGAGSIEVTQGDNTDGLLWAAEHMAAAAIKVEITAAFTAELADLLQTLGATWVGDAPVTEENPAGTADVAADTFTRSP